MTMESVAGMGYGGAHQNTQLQRALIELQSIKSEVLAGGAANAALAVSGIDIQDHVISAIMFASGVPSAVVMTIKDRRASGTLTLSGVEAGDAVAVNGKTFTAVAFTPNGSNSGELGPYKFAVGGTDTVTAANLAAAVNAMSIGVIATSAAAVVTIKAVAPGVAGNSIAIDDAASNGNVTESGATLSGGTDTQSVSTTTDSTGNTILLTWARKTRVVGQL